MCNKGSPLSPLFPLMRSWCNPTPYFTGVYEIKMRSLKYIYIYIGLGVAPCNPAVDQFHKRTAGCTAVLECGGDDACDGPHSACAQCIHAGAGPCAGRRGFTGSKRGCLQQRRGGERIHNQQCVDKQHFVCQQHCVQQLCIPQQRGCIGK